MVPPCNAKVNPCHVFKRCRPSLDLKCFGSRRGAAFWTKTRISAFPVTPKNTYARKVATAKVNEAPKPQHSSPKIIPTPPNMAQDPTALCSTRGPKNTRPPKTPHQETKFTRETYKKIDIHTETRVPNCAEQFGVASFSFLLATETRCPYRSLGGYAWAVVRRIMLQSTPGSANLKKYPADQNGSPHGRAKRSKCTNLFWTKSAK
mgnify:CR=1 FL=1